MLFLRVSIITVLLTLSQSFSSTANFFAFSEAAFEKVFIIHLSESFDEADFSCDIHNYFQHPYYGETGVRVNPTYIRKRVSKVISSFSFRYFELIQIRKYLDNEILSSSLQSHISSVNIFYSILLI